MESIRWNRKWAAVLAAMLVAGCSGDDPAALSVCTSNVTVTATVSTTPTVSWEPCLASQLVIQTTDPTPQPVWSAYVPDNTNIMLPPIAYGQPPAGISQLPAIPPPLQAGTTYTINLFAGDPAAQGGVRLVGSVELTP